MPQLKYWDPVIQDWMSMPAGPIGPTGPMGPMGAGSASVHVGTELSAPDPASYGLWVVTTDNGPWDVPLAGGTYSLRVSNGTTWFPIAGGGGTGPSLQPPTAAFTTDVHWAHVSVNASISTDPDGYITNYDWDWGDGTPHGSGITAEHTYTTSGVKTIVLTVVDNTGAGDQDVQTVTTTVMYGPVTFTTQGASFAPKLWQVADSPNQIEWINPTTNAVLATGPLPNINFGTQGQRQVQLWCSRPLDVLTLNVGYNTGHDTGNYLPGAAGGATTGPGEYNLDPQRVTAITGYNTVFTNLVNFMAAGSPVDPTLGTHRLTGATDFSGMSNLQFIECAYARVNSTNLTGCTSLIRLCFEENDWRGNTIDLNPVRNNLRDLRMAFQGGVVFTPLTGPMTQLYHECTRAQPCTNLMSYPNTPALNELWTWETNQSGTLVLSPLIYDVRVQDNQYTAVDFSHTSPSGQGLGQCDLGRNPLTSIIGLAAGQHFQTVGFQGCNLTRELVDSVLAAVNSWGTANGYLNLAAPNAAPTNGVNNADRLALVARGWTVNVVA